MEIKTATFIIMVLTTLCSCNWELAEIVPESLPPWECGQDFIDTRDGEIYKTVKLASQCWFAENLRYDTIDSYCYRDSVTCKTNGRLYKGYLLNSPILCPPGWHISSDIEWKELEESSGMPVEDLDIFTTQGVIYRGISDNVAGRLLDADGLHILYSGFAYFQTSLPSYDKLDTMGYYWTSTIDNSDLVFIRSFTNNISDNSNQGIGRSKDNLGYAYCIRCVQD